MRSRQWVSLLAALGLVTCVVALAACGGDDGSGTEASGTTSSSSSSPKKIAWLNALSNTYQTAATAEIDRIADETGAEVTEFVADYEVAKQQQQLQNVIASNQYDGIIIAPIGAEVATDVASASNAGLKTTVITLVLGPDLGTALPQEEGVDFSVLSPPRVQGVGMGELAVDACKDKDPCRVVYIYGVKGAPSDNAYIEGFEEGIEANKAIEIVAEGEGKYEGPDVALAEMQNILQSTPDFDVVVGVDQSMQGVQIALEQVDKLEDVAIIGLGGSEAAVDAIAAGKWFGDVMTAPATEGEIAMNGMLELLEGKTPNPAGVNPATEFPNNGLITQDNVDQFEAQWKG
jgi:ribose transport system substrate-binding protein